MADEKRIGRQTPTVCRTLPYDDSKGQEAIDLYNSTKRTCQEWQGALLYDILATDAEGLWTHMKVGYSVPRRNGKSEILIMRELYALMQGERVMHTAHRTTTSHSAWEKLCAALAELGYTEKDDYKTTKQFGLERIEFFETGAVVNFRTRSSKGGLGEGYDLLIIDEAQEYTTDQESALKYVVTDSKNPQTILCGTPPTTVSAGTVFPAFRRSVLTDGAEYSMWAEWSVPEMSDVRNRDLWYETNPSLGIILSERTISAELGGDEGDLDLNIQRLGLWVRYNQKSAISDEEWSNLYARRRPNLLPERYFAVKFGHDGANISLSVAAKTEGEKIFVETIDCRPTREGMDWILPYVSNPHGVKVSIDGRNGQAQLVDLIRDFRLKIKVVLPDTADIIKAHSMFESAIFAETICHKGQPSVCRVVGNCEKRAVGNNGGFAYNSILEGADISILDSIVLAHWLASTDKPKVKAKAWL